MSREGVSGFGSLGGWTRLPKSKDNKATTQRKNEKEKKKKKKKKKRKKKIPVGLRSRELFTIEQLGSIKYLMQRRIE